MSLRRRVDTLESAHARRQRRMLAAIAAEDGLSPDEFIEEAEAFFRLPLAEQLTRVDDLEAELHAAGLSAEDMAEIKETLIRYDQPMD